MEATANKGTDGWKARTVMTGEMRPGSSNVTRVNAGR